MSLFSVSQHLDRLDSAITGLSRRLDLIESMKHENDNDHQRIREEIRNETSNLNYELSDLRNRVNEHIDDGNIHLEIQP